MSKMSKNKINRTNFIEQLALSMGISKVQAEEVLANVLDLIVENVAEGTDVNLTGFGSFYQITRKQRQGINPKTGAKMTIPASKSAGFRVGKKFKDTIQGN
jgi:DNA-binding protein HU-beta